MDSLESNRQSFGKNYGLATALSPYDLPWGAFLKLRNLQDVVPGEIRTRKGLAPASAYTGTPGSNAILSLAAFASPLGQTIVTHDAGGAVKARRSGSSISLATGMSTAVPMRFCRTRDNQLILTNGLQRGKIWPGANAAALTLGVDPPAAAIDTSDVTLASGGGLSEGTYLFAQRFVDYDNLRGEPAYSDLSPVLSKTATDGQKATYDVSDLEDPSGRGTHRQIWRTTVDESSVFYLVDECTVGETVDIEDTYTDQQLIDAAAEDPEKVMPIRGAFGLVARRFTPPPIKAVCVQHRDYFFYGVDVPYTTGTVSITSTDATVTGSGTAWTSDFEGRYLWIDGANQPYEILSVTNGTSLELTENAAESLSGKAYKIVAAPEERNQVYFSGLDEPQSVSPTFAFTVQASEEDDDELAALLPLGSVLYCLKSGHTYAFAFSRHPGERGAGATQVFSRGCLNQGCWSVLEGTAYVLDAKGAYAFRQDGLPQAISEPIQDYWRDGTIDFSAAAWFFAVADPVSMVVRFFVKFTGDSGDRPTRALCYHAVFQTWWEEEHVHEIGGADRVEEGTTVRMVVGANHDRLYYLGSGEFDGVSSQILGTATSATSGTLSDSSAPFGSTDSLIGASVVIADGTGFGQMRRVTANTSSQLTIAPNWTTTPSTDSKYVVGGIAWELESGYQPILDQARKEEENKSIHATVEPIRDDLPMRVRQYWDFDSSAETLPTAFESPDRLVSWESGSTDKKVSIHLTAKTDDAGNGVNRGRVSLFDYAKSGGSRLQGKSHVAVEIEGAKGRDAIVLHRLEISGTGK